MGRAITAAAAESARADVAGIAAGTSGATVPTGRSPGAAVAAKSTIATGTAVTADSAGTTGTSAADHAEVSARPTDTAVAASPSIAPRAAVTAGTAGTTIAANRGHIGSRVHPCAAVGTRAAEPAGTTDTPGTTGAPETDQQTRFTADTTVTAITAGTAVKPGATATAWHRAVAVSARRTRTTAAAQTTVTTVAEQEAAVTACTAGTTGRHQLETGAAVATGAADAHQPTPGATVPAVDTAQASGAAVTDHPGRATVSAGHAGMRTGIETRTAITEQPTGRPAMRIIQRSRDPVGDDRAHAQRHERRIDDLVHLLTELAGDPVLDSVVQRPVEIDLETLGDSTVNVGPHVVEQRRECLGTTGGVEIGRGMRGEVGEHLEYRMEPVFYRFGMRRRHRGHGTHPEGQESTHRRPSTTRTVPGAPRTHRRLLPRKLCRN